MLESPSSAATTTPPYWIPSLGESAEKNFLLSHGCNGSIDILDPEAPASAVRLALETEEDILTHVDEDGQLHIIEFPEGLEEMHWHIIDLESGDSLSVEHREVYLECDPQDLVHHAATRIFSMSGPHTISILDAASRETRSEWHVTPQHMDPSLGVTRLGNIRFSPHGDMLAVTMHLVLLEGQGAFDEAGAVGTAEVHIYNCKSGDCLQSHQLGGLTANCYRLQWSSHLNLLAVFSRHEDDHEGSCVQQAASGSLCFLDPAMQQVNTGGDCAKWLSQHLWDCQWTPDGDLLVASSRPNDHNFSTHLVIDPHTMATLLTAREANDSRHPGMSWAVKPASRLRKRTLTVYLRGQCTLISFVLEQGEWQASRLLEDQPAGCFGGCIIPSGEAVTAFQFATGGSCSVSHWDIQTGQIHEIAPGHTAVSLLEPWQPDRMWLLPEYPAFRRGWSPVYAYIHKTSSKPQHAACKPSVNLVHAASHQLLGSWTCQDLLCSCSQESPEKAQQLSAESWQLCGLRWAPNNRHLAVYDKFGCTWVLSFS